MLAYFKPTTVEEAVELKAQHPQGAFLGGGTSINSLGWSKRVDSGRAQGYDALIDISGADMGGIEEKDGFLRIGANLCFQDVLEHALCPNLLRAAFKQIVNRNVRNMATLGGALSLKSPCSNPIAALLALHAEVELSCHKGTKRLAVEEFLEGDYHKALLTAVYIPGAWAQLNCATRRYSRSQNDISIVLADVVLDIEDGKVAKISAVAGGVAPTVRRLRSLEESLKGRALPSEEEVAALVQRDISAIDDLRGSAAFKTYTAGQLVDWCLHRAAESGSGGCCEHKGEPKV